MEHCFILYPLRTRDLHISKANIFRLSPLLKWKLRIAHSLTKQLQTIFPGPVMRAQSCSGFLKQNITCPSPPPLTILLQSFVAAIAVTPKLWALLITYISRPVSGMKARIFPSFQADEYKETDYPGAETFLKLLLSFLVQINPFLLTSFILHSPT